MTNVERKLCANKQHSGRECLKILRLPDRMFQNDLKSRVCDMFRERDVDIDSVSIEPFHRLKSNH